MISIHIRRLAAQVSATTGQSIQDFLSEIVQSINSGMVDFRSRRCPFCGSAQEIVTHTMPGSDVVMRRHKCTFCTTTFNSREEKISKMLDESNKPIALSRKKPHIKKRGA